MMALGICTCAPAPGCAAASYRRARAQLPNREES
jgi:hypothetical protein